MKYQQYLKTKCTLAKNSGKEETAIKLLVLELSNLNGAELVARFNDEMDQSLIDKLDQAIDLYLINNIPVQHIIGYSYFYGYKMIVNSNVLIPRSETEELVGYVLAKYDEVFNGKSVDVIDVGTGSGAIAIALKKEEPSMKISASDISVEALEVAKINALNNEADVTFFVGDMLEPFIERKMKVDILVSNPPYIPDDEYVEDIVKDNEPHIALFGGKDGLYFYDKILSKAHLVLKDKAIMAFEHSYSKGKELGLLIKKYFPNAFVELIQDLNGLDRITIAVVSKE